MEANFLLNDHFFEPTGQLKPPLVGPCTAGKIWFPGDPTEAGSCSMGDFFQWKGAWYDQSLAGVFIGDFAPKSHFLIDRAWSIHFDSTASGLASVEKMQTDLPAIRADYSNGFAATGCQPPAHCALDCVWPGDADASGRVDLDDVLAIGLALAGGATGQARADSISNWWAPFSAENWSKTIPNTLLNAKNADSDGNGHLDKKDIEPLAEHFWKTNSPDFQAPNDIFESGGDLFLSRSATRHPQLL